MDVGAQTPVLGSSRSSVPWMQLQGGATTWKTGASPDTSEDEGFESTTSKV